MAWMARAVTLIALYILNSLYEYSCAPDTIDSCLASSAEEVHSSGAECVEVHCLSMLSTVTYVDDCFELQVCYWWGSRCGDVVSVVDVDVSSIMAISW